MEDYAYDGEGNRTASHLSAVYASNDHNQLLEDDTYTYAYDAKGNRISRTAKAGGVVETYTYDSQNRLVGYAGASTATYAYDALDRRIAKTVDGVVEAFVYDSMDLGDSTASNTTLTFRAGQLIKRWLFGPQVDEPLAFEGYTATTSPGTGSVIELLANRLGSIITAISVSTGAVAAEYNYDSFGTRTQTGVLEQPYGFTGREHDTESGLMHYRARVYDPAAGVFLQVDPIEMASGTAHLYGYVSQNPYFSTDPSGLLSGDPNAPKTVGGAVGEWLAAARREARWRSKSVGAVAVASIGGAAFIAAVLDSIGFIDLEEGLPDDETPTPEPEPQPAGDGKKPPGHHCQPVSYGFPFAQSLVDMSKAKHDRLHALMRKHFQAMSAKYLDKISSMDYGKGRTNLDIATAVGIDVIKDALDQFYELFPEFGC